MCSLKTLYWIASSRDDLREFPDSVRQVMGFALFLAQSGEKHTSAKPLKGFGGSGVLEIVQDHDGDTYRSVYTVRFKTCVYVLHAFQKKSRTGISTPPRDLHVIASRLKLAQQHYETIARESFDERREEK